MWILSFMGETRINHCVQALHKRCLTPEEHFAYFQLENFFVVVFLRRKRMLQLRAAESGCGPMVDQRVRRDVWNIVDCIMVCFNG